jgi:hypothetical protein
MSDRVCIGSCMGPADAAVVRAMLAGHGIASVVTGEQHANVLGGLGGELISLEIWVAAKDGEQASALLAELRGQGGEEGGEGDEGGEEEPEEDDGEGDDDDAPVEVRVERRRRTGVALLLGACITFGAAHMYAGAWMRGIALGLIDIVAIRFLASELTAAAAAVWIASIVADIVGAAYVIRATTTRTQLPTATLRR